MNRNQTLVVAVVLLSVGGLAVAAATVSTPSSSDPGTGSGDVSSGDDEGSSPPERSPGADDSGESRLIVFLGVVLFVIGLLAMLIPFLKWLTPRRAVALVVVVGVVTVSILLVMGGLMDSVPEMSGIQIEPEDQGGGGDGGAGGEATSESPQSDFEVSLGLLGVVGLAMILLAAAVYRYSGTDVDVALEEQADETEEPTSVKEIGQAAGRAADRLEGASDLENAIYRAWREMTDALDVTQPRTTTPEEFAEIAIEAGMSDTDVRQLTRVFEEVRYGNRQPTPEREQRAQEALRRIQRTYAGGDSNE